MIGAVRKTTNNMSESKFEYFLFRIKMAYLNFWDNRRLIDCNKCGAWVPWNKLKCKMGGAKGEIPDVCYKYGAICKKCWKDHKNDKYD